MVGLQHWKGVGIRRFLLEDGEPSLSIALLDTEAPGSWNRSASIRVVQHNVQARAYKPLVQVHVHVHVHIDYIHNCCVI